jgi:hypothetical protein
MAPALALPDSNLTEVEVEVLDPQVEAFVEAHAGAVEQGADEPVEAAQLAENLGHLADGEHDGHGAAALGPGDRVHGVVAEDLPIQEGDTGRGLVSGLGGELPLSLQILEEGFGVATVQVVGVGASMEAQELVHPGAIRGPGARAVLPRGHDALGALEDALDLGIVGHA